MNRYSLTSEPSDLRDFYDRNGYLIVEDVLTHDEVDALLAEASAIARGFRGSVRGVLPSDDTTSDDDVLGRYLAIHFPHKASPMMHDALSHPAFVKILTSIIGPNVKCMQSMLFVKPSGKPGQAWHQDEFYIPTRDRSLVGLWVALDDATIENGCVWVRPGSHADGVLYPTRAHESPDFDSGNEIHGTPDDTDEGVAAEIRAGSVLLFNGYVHHRSLPNRAEAGTYRRALVNHYMSAESELPWWWDGRIEPTQDNRDIVMVAGSDPYAWKGLEDHTFPLCRAETRSADDPNHDGDKAIF